MKRITLLVALLSTMASCSVAFGHASAIPLVDLAVTLDEDALTYKAAVPTFAFDPLRDVQLGSEYPSLDERKEEIENFIATTCPVKIDGIAVRPVLESLAFGEPAEAPSSPFATGPEADSYGGGPDADSYGAAPEADGGFGEMSGIGPPSLWLDAYMTLSYSTKGKPRRVSMGWNLFTEEALEETEIPGLMSLDQSLSSSQSMNVDGVMTTGSPDEVIAVLTAFGRKKYVVFNADEPGYVWHADGLTSRADQMAVVPHAAEKTISLPIVPMVAGALLLSLLLAVRAARMSRGFATVALVIVLIAGVAGQNVVRIEIKPFWRGGMEMPDKAEAKEIFAALHRNVYRAFDYETEDSIYDALAQSVSGELLDQIYNDVYQGLILSEEGGAICKIERVEILESQMQTATEERGADLQFSMSCNWRVLGLVEHWGHVHRRVNEYSAIYTLSPSGDQWKISGVDMTDQLRVTGKTQ